MIVGFCGLALLVVSLFVFWKLCWPIWRNKSPSQTQNASHVDFSEALSPPNSAHAREYKVVEVEKKNPLEVAKSHSTVRLQEAALKISQTSPDIPADLRNPPKEKVTQSNKVQRQTTEPTSSSRYCCTDCSVCVLDTFKYRSTI